MAAKIRWAVRHVITPLREAGRPEHRRMKTASQRAAKAKETRKYSSRLVKGGALLNDMRLLVRLWRDGSDREQRKRIVANNILGKGTRARALDTLTHAFLPRFVHGSPAGAWRLVRPLEERGLPIEVLKPVYYWITARGEPILYDFVCQELERYGPQHFLSTRDVVAWVQRAAAGQGKAWSAAVTQRVARSVLAALRDFGILEGRNRKRVAAVYLPVESFAYLAYLLHSLGASGQHLVQHPDWRLFLLGEEAVERLFLEADRCGLLTFNAAGQIVRVDFPAGSCEEMADVVARTAHA
ncbi:MAG: hypothetical protein KatS3mg109_1996 [Pirellulaceae bacterium]|nr:MAG: hypothetical protein KatS3mg109_1996 [Pirellulaceae bacterium]